jgi:hypothetical protein
MASLAQQVELAPRIEHALDYLIREWEAIPEVVSTWDTWDELDRLDFVIEWPIREVQLKQLRQWQGEGQFSAEQLKRFGDLERLIARHRAAVERLLAD